MRLQEETAVDILLVAREIFLYKQLGHVVHDLRAKLMNLEEFDYGQGIARVFPIYQLLEVKL